MVKKGFTLIEVMVVLSILAIIAILAYNFFGGTMKEAQLSQKVTKVMRDMQVISDAWEQWSMDNGNYTSEPSNAWVTLVSDGYLRSWPTPPSGTAICGGGTCNGMYSYLTVGSYEDYDNDGTSDAAISLEDLTTEFCTEFADRVGTTIYDYGTEPDFGNWGGGQWVVFDWSGATADDCAIHLILRYN